MKISIDYSDQDDLRVKVIDAEYLGNYVLRILFDDGTQKKVDFGPFIIGSLHPAIKKYQDEKLFSDFEVKEGNVNWNDYDLIFPIWNLYQGKIVA